jgi:TatD DNase family protein
MKFVDSHCHIDGEAFDADRDEVVRRAHEAGVAAMLVVGTGDPHGGEIAKAVETAEKYEYVFASVGVHPHDAKLYDERAEETLVRLVKSSPKVVAWGEIGLDYYYDHSPRDVQREVFVRQIRTARDLNLPVIIHSRDADEETVEILARECAFPDFKGIMHCFGGTADMAQALMDIGFLISLAGNVTFKKAENLREAARVVPLEKLLIETDCPFLTPVPFRGKRNEPLYVVETAKFLAEFYGVELKELANRTTQNFLNLFNLKLAAN